MKQPPPKPPVKCLYEVVRGVRDAVHDVVMAAARMHGQYSELIETLALINPSFADRCRKLAKEAWAELEAAQARLYEL